MKNNKLKRVYTANLGYSGSSFIAYVLGLHEEIHSVHQPRVPVHFGYFWTPSKESASKNVGHNLGKLWMKDKQEFLSIDWQSSNKIPNLQNCLINREQYISNLMKDKPGEIYHESANSLFPLLNIYKTEGTKFINLVRDPWDWIKRSLANVNPGDYVNDRVHHRNAAFHNGECDVECVSNLWKNINSMILDISDNNRENWINITLDQVRDEPEKVWPKVFEFLELEPPPVDFKNINKETKEMGPIQPNDTFFRRNIHNSKKKGARWDPTEEMTKKSDLIDSICTPLWKEINERKNTDQS